MEIKGTFKPPAVGVSSMPIPISGRGVISVTSAGLDARGFVLPKNPLVPLVFGAILAFVLLSGYLKVKYLPGLSTATLTVGIAIAVGTLLAALRGAQAVSPDAKQAPLTLSIPWSSVAKVSRDLSDPRCLIIGVKKFSPKGTIHFEPEGDLEAAWSALNDRAAA